MLGVSSFLFLFYFLVLPSFIYLTNSCSAPMSDIVLEIGIQWHKTDSISAFLLLTLSSTYNFQLKTCVKKIQYIYPTCDLAVPFQGIYSRKVKRYI